MEDSVTASGLTTNSSQPDVIEVSILWYNIIHSLAVNSLLINTIVSVGLIIYALCVKADQKFFSRSIGDRLAIYLATCDLFYGLSHLPDHIYRLIAQAGPPDGACVAFAFCLQHFLTTQSIIIVCTAINAFFMVVKNKTIDLGYHDWKLLCFACITPLLPGIVALCMGFLGPSGLW